MSLIWILPEHVVFSLTFSLHLLPYFNKIFKIYMNSLSILSIEFGKKIHSSNCNIFEVNNWFQLKNLHEFRVVPKWNLNECYFHCGNFSTENMLKLTVCSHSITVEHLRILVVLKIINQRLQVISKLGDFSNWFWTV